MRIRASIAIAAIAAVSVVGTAGTASAASSYYGSPTSADKYYAVQTAPDCVEWTARVAIDEVEHKSAVSQKSIDAEAQKLGLYVPGKGSQGPNWPALFKHYGAKASFSSMSRTRLEADLAKGDAIIATVNAETLWAPLGYVTAEPSTGPDHAVVVEAVNKATGAVTLADGGIPIGENEVVSWSTFSKAWSAGDYQTAVVTK